ncbi:MAG: hypothetical protein GY884_29570 [Proteobacteria bacterium]|nr:hypothetical protein [Pseudomonadota bacterium]MCP4894483.1 hypothetical protein [Actinomycetales bacterium]
MKQSKRRLYWRRMVDEHAASGLTQVAFAAQRGISVKSLYRWRGCFRGEAQAAWLPAVVEVVLDSEPAAPPPPRDLRLVLGSDLALVFDPATEPAYVADVVVALRERGAC